MATGGNLGGATFTVNANILPFTRGMQQAQQAAKSASNAIGRDLSHGANQAAMGFLELSRAIEDAQYGFRGVVNNIPQMVMLFGGSAGLAGAISIAAVGVNQLIEHWGDLSDRMNAAWSGSTIEQLRKVRETAEEAAAAFDKLAKAPTELEAKGAKAMEKMIVEGPAGKILEQVLAGVANTPGLAAELTEREKKALGQEMTVGMRPMFPFVVPEMRAKSPAEAQAAIAAEIDRRNRAKAAGLIGEMSLPGERGAAARRTVATIAPGLAKDIGAASPEGVKAKADHDARVKHLMRMNEADMGDEAESAKKAKKSRDDRIRALMRMNEAQMEMEADSLKEQKKDREDAKRRGQRFARMRHRIRDIVEDMRGEPEKSEFMGFAEFHKSTQMGILNGPNDIQKRQLAALEKIRDLIEENPEMRSTIVGNFNAALAAGPN